MVAVGIGVSVLDTTGVDPPQAVRMKLKIKKLTIVKRTLMFFITSSCLNCFPTRQKRSVISRQVEFFGVGLFRMFWQFFPTPL
jgi:hypothetical protein